MAERGPGRWPRVSLSSPRNPGRSRLVRGRVGSVAVLNDAARALIESGALGHMVTLDDDGSPQVSVVWVGLENADLITGHLDRGQRKLRNLRRDARVTLSFEAATRNEIGMRHYLVVHGHARISEGGAADLLGRLAQTYVGPGAIFPPMSDPPRGFVTRITPVRIGGIGPWRT